MVQTLLMKHLDEHSTLRWHWWGGSWFLSWSTHFPQVFILSNVTKETHQNLWQFLISSWDSDDCSLIYTPPLNMEFILHWFSGRNTVEKWPFHEWNSFGPVSFSRLPKHNRHFLLSLFSYSSNASGKFHLWQKWPRKAATGSPSAELSQKGTADSLFSAGVGGRRDK